jgi:hypothetical protein
VGYIARTAQVGRGEAMTAARANDLGFSVFIEVAEELDQKWRLLDEPAPAPPVLAQIRLKVKTF